MKKLVILFSIFIVNICNAQILKQLLINEVNSYIKTIAPTSKLTGECIVDKCLYYNIDIAFVLAQGQIESHYGTAGTAKNTNSVFNIGAYDGHSANKQRKNGFGFDYPDDSVEPYLKVLINDYLVNGKTEYDLMSNYVNYLNMRYASNKNYERMLKSVYNKIKKATNIYDLQYNIICDKCCNNIYIWIH